MLRLIRYIIHSKMKAIMIALMLGCIGSASGLLVASLDRWEQYGITNSVVTLWLLLTFVVLIGICAFRYACKLGREEDIINRFKNRDIADLIDFLNAISPKANWRKRIAIWFHRKKNNNNEAST